MYIQLEKNLLHTVQAYTEKSITIADIEYTTSLLVSKDQLLTDLSPKTLQAIDNPFLDQLTNLQPELVILGHTQISTYLPATIQAQLSQQGIGIETMQLGAACRTFNLLLSEGRRVILGVILP